MARRVVITSMGLVSNLGLRSEQVADSFRHDRTHFGQSTMADGIAVSPVPDFDIKAVTGRFKNLRYLNRGAALATAAACRTVKKAALTPEQLSATGLFVGNGPNLDLGDECPDIENGRMAADKLPALWLLRFLPNTAASAIAQLTGVHGDNLSVGTACSASLQAIGEAFRKIKDGYLDTALAGGGDSRLGAGGLLAYQKARALYDGPEEPAAASRPFDTRRSGFVPGEGGAFFLLESLPKAQQRGTRIWAEVVGYGAAMDGGTMTAPHPDGVWAEQAVRSALDEAGLPCEQIEAIAAHGTGTPLNDAMEAALIGRLFRHRPPVLALKSWIGHLASACGAVELALVLSGWRHGILPGIRNLVTPCNPNLNFLRETASGPQPQTLLLENFGFGGQNAALVIKPWNS